MGVGDAIRNKAEEIAGKAKEAAGSAADASELEAEGRADQAIAKGKRAGENAHEVLSHATEAVKDDDDQKK